MAVMMNSLRKERGEYKGSVSFWQAAIRRLSPVNTCREIVN